MDDTRELFRALEFAHYAERFRDATFVIALPEGTPFTELVLDFKVLAGYHIRVVLVTRDPDFRLDQVISVANKRGSRFQLWLVTDVLLEPEQDVLQLDFQRVRATLAQGRTPVIAYHGAELGARRAGVDPTYALAAQVALKLEARKLFLVHPLAGRLRAALPRSAVQTGELEGLPQRLDAIGLPEAGPVCAFIAEQIGGGIPDVVLLEGRSAHLFREVFTYDGAGILFTATRASRIRRAEMRDVTDMTLLLRPEVESGAILPMPESRIEANIANYWVYEIDGMLVGLAGLKRFGDSAELAQFATLPRYRGRGRARELAQFLEQQAREQGFRRVFALSIDPRMWEFFQYLGFQPVEREALPETWRQGYDLSRPSRALLKEL
ncbi:MAG TPA: GNAT family N-acetyltransferase [bacterium]|jgi:N-acetylglutamate synthase-like GNAT family acetyltransferase